jgi:hypothetical protein
MSKDPRLHFDATPAPTTRAAVMEQLLGRAENGLDPNVDAALAALDAVDPLRRALTPDTDEHEAAVERVGLVLAGHFSHGGDAEHAYRVNPRYRIYAGKVLAALRDLA